MLGMDSQYTQDHCKLCACHFDASQFTSPERNRLMPTALPTLFLHNEVTVIEVKLHLLLHFIIDQKHENVKQCQLHVSAAGLSWPVQTYTVVARCSDADSTSVSHRQHMYLLICYALDGQYPVPQYQQHSNSKKTVKHNKMHYIIIIIAQDNVLYSQNTDLGLV